MQGKKISSKLLKFGLISITTSIAPVVFAAGSYVPFTNASDLGSAYSGQAALAADASTNYTNSAGLVDIAHQQIVISSIGLLARSEYRGTAYAPGMTSPESGKASFHTGGVIPAIHYALPINDKLFFGLSLTAPYGFGYNYPANSLVRYDVVKVESKSLDLSPSLAYKLNDQFSVGFGLDAAYVSLYQKYMVATQPLTTSDSAAKIDLAGWGLGWHTGLLYQFTPTTRVGLNYRSQIVTQLSGESELSLYDGPYQGTSKSKTLRSRVALPPTTSLSLYQSINTNWAVMGTVEYTQWNIFKKLPISNAAYLGGQTISTSVPQYYHNSWRYAVGASYQLNPQWLLKAGTSYDEGATNGIYRDVLVPEGDRIDLALGGHYQANTALGLDMGYVHSFYKSVPVNYHSATGVSLHGSYKPSVDSLGLQLVWNII